MNLDFLKWDGTDVTEHLSKVKAFECKSGKRTFVCIKASDEIIYCMRRTCKNSLPAIIDEIKTFFKLVKVGTHQIVHKSKRYLLLKLISPQKGVIQDELTLKDIREQHPENNWIMTEQIQQILAFRELCGVTLSCESSIRIREGKLYAYPISFYEPGVVFGDTKQVIATTLLDKWFKNKTLEECIKNLVKIKTTQDIPERIFEIRNHINMIVERIDKSQITYVDFIISRILHYVQ